MSSLQARRMAAGPPMKLTKRAKHRARVSPARQPRRRSRSRRWWEGWDGVACANAAGAEAVWVFEWTGSNGDSEIMAGGEEEGIGRAKIDGRKRDRKTIAPIGCRAVPPPVNDGAALVRLIAE